MPIYCTAYSSSSRHAKPIRLIPTSPETNITIYIITIYYNISLGSHAEKKSKWLWTKNLPIYCKACSSSSRYVKPWITTSPEINITIVQIITLLSSDFFNDKARQSRQDHDWYVALYYLDKNFPCSDVSSMQLEGKHSRVFNTVSGIIPCKLGLGASDSSVSLKYVLFGRTGYMRW